MYAFVFADVKQALIQWQERIEFAHKLLTLLNSYSPPELRNACIGKLLCNLYISYIYLCKNLMNEDFCGIFFVGCDILQGLEDICTFHV